MATWQTPVTDWDGSTAGKKYYNFGDLDRVEQNTEYLKDEFASIGYDASTTTFTYPRTRTSFNQYASDLNRIEQNILELTVTTWLPLTWETPYTSWTSVEREFNYNDANRLEKNLYYIKEMLDNITNAYVKCGEPQAVCGELPGLF